MLIDALTDALLEQVSRCNKGTVCVLLGVGTLAPADFTVSTVDTRQ